MARQTAAACSTGDMAAALVAEARQQPTAEYERCECCLCGEPVGLAAGEDGVEALCAECERATD